MNAQVGTGTEDITAKLSELEMRIGHHFKTKALLEEAITASSYSKEHPEAANYQRLELLGDRAISLILTENLMAEGSLDEGKMTFLKAELENNQRLAEYGEEIGLRKYIRAREERDEISPKVVADVFEAICGAIYLDSGGAQGMKVVEKFLRNFDIFEQLKAKIAMAEDFLPIRNQFENKFRERNRCNPDIRFTYKSEGAAHQKQWRIEACAIRDPQTGRYVELHGVNSDRWFGSKKEAETDIIDTAYRYMEERGWAL
ncbi:MAG TPA: ribonuclease III domain-containing protein [Desulfobacteria bacterium]|nr:ribonuclease III domain-containing protein [Desulfobacteria bacterium]